MDSNLEPFSQPQSLTPWSLWDTPAHLRITSCLPGRPLSTSVVDHRGLVVGKWGLEKALEWWAQEDPQGQLEWSLKGECLFSCSDLLVLSKL
jgi:hypothetical protein